MAPKVATRWETVIGLEVHVQLHTETKMYCSCLAANSSDQAEANRHVCPVCLGHPGTLPRPNRQAVVRALTLAQKLQSRIHERSVFARKNYFYPDLPKGYQISQYNLPLAEGGWLRYWHNGTPKQCELVRIHLEEDTAKLFHLDDGTALLDYNRAGIPLMEIVSQPEFRNADECVAYLEELRSLLQRLGVSDAAMESGNMRCEPNVSIRPEGSDALRTKTEIKNLNSFATLRRAVEAEAERQARLYESGKDVHQATMRYDEARGATAEMRRKETQDDYRYFDEPDIPPLLLSRTLKLEAGESLRASTFEIRKYMVEDDQLSHEFAATIADDIILHRFYRLCCKDGHEPREVAKWVTGELVRLLREAPLKIEPGALSNVLCKQATGELNLTRAKQVFEQVYLSGRSCEAIIEELGFNEEKAELDYSSICQAVIDKNSKVVADIQGGKHSALQVLVGAVMRETRGAADAETARETFKEKLGI